MTRIAVTATTVVLALCLGAACEVRDAPEEPAAAPAEQTAEPSQPAAEPAPTPEPPSVPPSEVPSPPGPTVGGGGNPAGQPAPPESMKKLGEMLGRAAEAADEASAEGGSHCERAYAGAAAMAQALHEQMGSDNAEASLPPRGDFVSACEDLPEEVQRCMIVSYSIQNQAECRRVREENEELMNRVREIMGQARGSAR